jgi:RNA polymerase sigma factor (sigma-70 family)
MREFSLAGAAAESVVGARLAATNYRFAGDGATVASTAQMDVRPDQTLIRRAVRGDRAARDRVVVAQLPAIRSTAARYTGLGLPLEDLVQEAALGLLEALPRYDAARGSFDAFARARTRHAIADALTKQSRLVRLPKHLVGRRRAIARATAEIRAAGGTPCERLIADAVGIAPAAVVEARRAGVVPVPLEEAASAAGPDPAETVGQADEALRVREALAHLPERQREVVSRHFGVGGQPTSLAGVASSLRLSPQRTRAIEQAALAELLTTLCGELPTAAPRRF